MKSLHTPTISLDHIIKERYPTFTDALRDLDDALSLLHTFANLPSSNTIPSATTAECERLCCEWQHYIMRTQSLRKSFLSIKGIYYQAEVNGQDIFWLVPYKFAQNTPIDVDYRIMKTFIDFYQVLLGFVMFRLFTIEGLIYPPKFDVAADSKGAGLRAFSLEAKGVKLIENGISESNGTTAVEGKDVSKQLKTLSEKIARISTTHSNEEEIIVVSSEDNTVASAEPELDSFPAALPASDVLPQPDLSTVVSGLFSNCTFFLSRETPRAPLEFLLRSFGCRRIGWDAVLGDGFFTDNERDPNITHQVVDRPPQQGPNGEVQVVRGGRVLGRIYVQPQYVWDCINGGKLLRPDPYAPGEVLPPHLSPWVKKGEGYDPTAPLPEEEDEGEGEEEEEEEETRDEEQLETDGNSTQKVAVKGTEASESEFSGDSENEHEGMTIDMASSDEEAESESEFEAETARKNNSHSINETKASLPVGEGEEELSETELVALQYQVELEAEAFGKPLPAPTTRRSKEFLAQAKREREEAEEKEMAKIMMPRKKRKLYEKMVRGNRKREAEVKELQDKRRKLVKQGNLATKEKRGDHA